MMTKILERFYGYKHWTIENIPRCFNVGKGIKGRSSQVKNRNHKWHAIVKRFGLHVEVCIGPVSNEKACIWEIETISEMKTFSTNHSHDDMNNIGCNFTLGGEGTPGRVKSIAERTHHSIMMKGKSSPNKGKTMSDMFGNQICVGNRVAYASRGREFDLPQRWHRDRVLQER